MEDRSNAPFLQITLFAVIVGLVLLVGAFVIPWSRVNWGKIELAPSSTITVTGQAQEESRSQVATFTAGATVTNKDKQVATDEVNVKMTQLIQAVKNFGIPQEDIRTQNVSVYQQPEGPEILIYPPRPRSGELVWVANNSILITLRDVNKASALAELLNQSGATEVSGPNFTLDDMGGSSDLLAAAFDDARAKADKVAKASGRKLGKVVTVTEGSSPVIYPLLEKSAGGSGVPAPVEPGSQATYKSVTVVFELR